MLKLLTAASLLLAGICRVEAYAAERNAGAKRQVQYAEPVPRAQQYSAQPGALQITPEYYAYLQQVQSQQYQPQQAPVDLNQALSARGPQRFQQPVIPRRPPVPEETRRLQESFNQQPIREQEREDQTNQQLIASGLNPTLVRRERLRQSAQRLAAQQAEENAARQALQAQEQQYQQLYGQPQQTNLVQLVPIPQEIPVQQPSESTPAPDRVSYSQVTFGSTKLPQQRLVPGRTQLIYNRPQAQQPAIYRQPQTVQPQQQVVYQPQFIYTTIPQRVKSVQPQQASYSQPEAPQSRAGPQVVYSQQPERSQEDTFQPQRGEAITYQRPRPAAYQPQKPRVLSYQPQRAQPESYQTESPEAYQPQPQAQYPQAEVTQKQTPDQYLIETTRSKPEPQQQVITIPRRQQFSYRPQSDYQELQAALIARQQQNHIARQQAEASASTTPAPRSSIYVTTARTSPKKYSLPAEYNSAPQHRPLTENELNALINAGFRVGSGEQEDQYDPRLAKRQNSRPRIGKVPLSEEEREMLAKNGIRSLYRVQTAESQDAPVTYVLAVENFKRETDESTST